MMASLTGDEPDLELGASGEDVMLLQVRLYALGIYPQVPDGTYDMVTESAVRELQSQVGQDNDGVVTQATWEAVVHQELQAGIQYQYQSPYDALSQIVYDLEHGAGGDQPISEDGRWRWDGTDWQPVEDGYGDAGQWADAGGDARQLSPDGQWEWDGTEWQPAGATSSGAASGDDEIGRLSDDGQWRWDGQQWQEAGQGSGGQGGGQEFTGLLSDDGQWRWDGSRWEAV